MNSNTKLFFFIDQWQDKFRTKFWIFETYFSISIFFFFFGFMCGNLFGTFLTFFRQFFVWDGMIIILTILLIEFINYLNFYCFKPPRISLQTEKLGLTQKKPIFLQTIKTPVICQTIQEQQVILNFNIGLRFINFYKLGLLLGFFIDAFKVGS